MGTFKKKDEKIKRQSLVYLSNRIKRTNLLKNDIVEA